MDTHTKSEHLLHLQKRLENSSLNATLRRGYAVLKKTDGAIVSSAHAVRPDDQLTARLNDGEIKLQVLQ